MRSMRARVTLAALSVLVMGACGGSKAGGTAGGPAAPPADAATTVVGASPGPIAADGVTTTVDLNGRRAQLKTYRDCLTQHGVTLPSVPVNGGSRPNGTNPDTGGTPPSGDPANGGQGGGGYGGRGGNLGSVLQDPANADAVTACASLAPQGGFGGPGGSQGNGQRGQAFQAYQSCLKDHGVEVPTTVAGGPPASIDRSSPAFAAADEVCQALLPQRNGGSTTTATTGP